MMTEEAFLTQCIRSKFIRNSSRGGIGEVTSSDIPTEILKVGLTNEIFEKFHRLLQIKSRWNIANKIKRSTYMLIKQMVKKDNTPMTHIIFNFLSSVFVILP